MYKTQPSTRKMVALLLILISTRHEKSNKNTTITKVPQHSLQWCSLYPKPPYNSKQSAPMTTSRWHRGNSDELDLLQEQMRLINKAAAEANAAVDDKAAAVAKAAVGA
jgi:hypothetical protein